MVHTTIANLHPNWKMYVDAKWPPDPLLRLIWTTDRPELTRKRRPFLWDGTGGRASGELGFEFE